MTSRAIILAAFVSAALPAAPALAGGIELRVAALPHGAVAFAFSGDDFLVKGDASEGGFSFSGLAPGAYNIEIVAPGLDVIGVDLRPRDLEDRPMAAGPVSSAVRDVILGFFNHTEDFFDARAMPIMAGASDRIVALVENVRRGRDTTLADAHRQVFFRLDLWDFEKSFGSWRKVRARPFLRRTVGEAEFDGTRYLYSDKLGGLDLAEDTVLTVEYSLDSGSENDPKEAK